MSALDKRAQNISHIKNRFAKTWREKQWFTRFRFTFTIKLNQINIKQTYNMYVIHNKMAPGPEQPENLEQVCTKDIAIQL